ncbi:MAG: ABC transporter permease subunit, partial [Coriobacteriia bacterium]|nr:ABC transporter permease subunit [Coriobacteriia bacterium]
MSWNLFFGTMRQRRVGLFWYSVGLVVYSWVMCWYWPLIGDEYQKLVDTLPPQFIQAFAGTDVDFSTLGGYFQAEYLGLMWIAIVGSAVILYASKAIGSEIGNGTMELLLSQPISRVRFVVTRIIGFVAYTAVVAAATFVPIAIFGPHYDIDLSTKTHVLLFLSGTVFMLAIGGVAFLLSALSRDGGKPASITAGLLGAMWIMHAVAQLADWADTLEP